MQYRFGDSLVLFLLRLSEVLNQVIFVVVVCSVDKEIYCVGNSVFVTAVPLCMLTFPVRGTLCPDTPGNQQLQQLQKHLHK